MNFIIGVLTVFLIINCVVLIFLVLVQLPKKDAGAGMAFGAGTADALFGSGSGNVLTKITKWSAGILLGLSLVLGYMHDKVHRDNSATDFARQVQQKQMQSAPIASPVQKSPAASAPSANNLLTTTPGLPAAATAGTNAPAPAK